MSNTDPTERSVVNTGAERSVVNTGAEKVGRKHRC